MKFTSTKRITRFCPRGWSTGHVAVPGVVAAARNSKLETKKTSVTAPPTATAPQPLPATLAGSFLPGATALLALGFVFAQLPTSNCQLL